MTKLDEVSNEEILANMKAGWRFYRKKVSSGSKDYEYIIMRKGSKSISLGTFTAERWNRIQRLRHLIDTNKLEVEKKISRYEARTRFQEARSNIMSRVSIGRGRIMSRTCLHVKNEFCDFWIWETQMPFFTFFEDVFKENVEYAKSIDESDSNWIVKAHAFYCAGCASYERKIMQRKSRLAPARIINETKTV